MIDPTLTATRENSPSGETVLVLNGELDFSTSAGFTRALGDTPFGEGTRVVIDLSELGYCDSTGITVLINAYQRAQIAGSQLILQGVRPDLMRVFGIVGLEQVFTFRSVAEDVVDDLRS